MNPNTNLLNGFHMEFVFACFQLELDCILGSVNVHLSPRQVHLLLEIANGLAVPGNRSQILYILQRQTRIWTK